jgi:hypothetical protein
MGIHSVIKYLLYALAASRTCQFLEKDRMTDSYSMITTMNAVNKSLPAPFSTCPQPGIIDI